MAKLKIRKLEPLAKKPPPKKEKIDAKRKGKGHADAHQGRSNGKNAVRDRVPATVRPDAPPVGAGPVSGGRAKIARSDVPHVQAGAKPKADPVQRKAVHEPGRGGGRAVAGPAAGLDRSNVPVKYPVIFKMVEHADGSKHLIEEKP